MRNVKLTKTNAFLANFSDCSFTIIKLCKDVTIAFMDNLSCIKTCREQIFGMIKQDYLEHIQHFHDANYRLLSATCYLMLRQICSCDIDIEFTSNGKPYDKNGKIFFSFSHTETTCAIAVSTQNVGVDIARIAPYDSDIARLICSSGEIENLSKSTKKDILLSELITRKESYIKFSNSRLCSISVENIMPVKYITVSLSPDIVCTVCK